ncbi:hypothetical protein [Tateyamaria sp. Alg231-49]|uniref:hypothetical protein n=1 Tax=Tateyamaria sp. Alg231-49 TaxID=1922219 RepID=UPI000D55267B|nr:hypothetical protein [Tateyamaria sp. Alg231-49]
MDDKLDTVLEDLRARLDGLQSQDTVGDHAERFCDDFYKLYALSRADMSAAESTRLLKFLSESAPTMDISIGYLLQDLLNRITALVNTSFQSLEWIQICEMRSTFEALIELYSDHMPVGLHLIDTDNVDGLIMAKGENEAQFHPTLTPDNFPQDHWWWMME